MCSRCQISVGTHFRYSGRWLRVGLGGRVGSVFGMIGTPCWWHTLRVYLFGDRYGGQCFAGFVCQYGCRVGLGDDHSVDPGSTGAATVVPFFLVEFEDAGLNRGVHQGLVVVGGAAGPLPHNAVDWQGDQVAAVGLGRPDAPGVLQEHRRKRLTARIEVIAPCGDGLDADCCVRFVGGWPWG